MKKTLHKIVDILGLHSHSAVTLRKTRKAKRTVKRAKVTRKTAKRKTSRRRK